MRASKGRVDHEVARMIPKSGSPRQHGLDEGAGGRDRCGHHGLRFPQAGGHGG
jgi:hypothetical protein